MSCLGQDIKTTLLIYRQQYATRMHLFNPFNSHRLIIYIPRPDVLIAFSMFSLTALTMSFPSTRPSIYLACSFRVILLYECL